MPDLTRRSFLRGVAGAAALATIPFGLKAEDFKPMPKAPGGDGYELEPRERLVIRAEAPAEDPGLVTLYGSTESGRDALPFYEFRIPAGHSHYCVVSDRYRVTVRASEGTAVSGVILASDRFLCEDGAERGGLPVFDRRIPPNDAALPAGVTWKERRDRRS